MGRAAGASLRGRAAGEAASGGARVRRKVAPGPQSCQATRPLRRARATWRWALRPRQARRARRRRRGDGRPAAPPHLLKQVLDLERFLDAAGGAEAGGPLLRARMRRHDHDRDRRQGRIAQLLRPELLPAHHRHHEVEQDERGRRHGLQPLERLLAVRGTDDPMAFILEDRDQRIAQIEIVLDDEDGRGAIVHLVGHGVPFSSRSIRFPSGGGCQNFEPPAPAGQDAWSPSVWPGACLRNRGMSPLPRGYLDTTVAIESARADGEAIRYRTIGTGFFIGLDYGDRSSSSAENYRLFLVTNRHVVADRDDLLIRVNTREGAARRVRLALAGGESRGWAVHPDERGDVAVVLINARVLLEAGGEVGHLPPARMAFGAARKELDIGPREGRFGLRLPLGRRGG